MVPEATIDHDGDLGKRNPRQNDDDGSFFLWLTNRLELAHSSVILLRCALCADSATHSRDLWSSIAAKAVFHSASGGARSRFQLKAFSA